MIDRRYHARAGPVDTGRARVFVDEACVLTMMRPSMTVSVFSSSQIWILALVCRNLKMRFCLEWMMGGRGGSQRGWRWVETNDRGGIPWEALARSCSVGVMGGLTIGWVMMRCTLVAMVAEFHVVIPLDCFASLCRARLWCGRACVSWPSDDDGCFPSLRSRRSRLETTCVCL